jgi:hypothetical protein
MTPRELAAIQILWRSATGRARRSALQALPELEFFEQPPEASRGAVLNFPTGDDLENLTAPRRKFQKTSRG